MRTAGTSGVVRQVFHPPAPLGTAEMSQKFPGGPALLADCPVGHILHHGVRHPRHPVRPVVDHGSEPVPLGVALRGGVVIFAGADFVWGEAGGKTGDGTEIAVGSETVSEAPLTAISRQHHLQLPVHIRPSGGVPVPHTYPVGHFVPGSHQSGADGLRRHQPGRIHRGVKRGDGGEQLRPRGPHLPGDCAAVGKPGQINPGAVQPVIPADLPDHGFKGQSVPLQLPDVPR